MGKANERKGKVKRGKDEEVNGQGEEGCPGPTRGSDGVELIQCRGTATEKPRPPSKVHVTC